MRTGYSPCLLPICKLLLACGPTASRPSADAVAFDTAERPADFDFSASSDGASGKWSVIDNDAGRGLARIGPEPSEYRLAFALYRPFSGRDVYVSTRFLTIPGQPDHAAGLFVRFRSPDDHYAVRAGAIPVPRRRRQARDDRKHGHQRVGRGAAHTWYRGERGPLHGIFRRQGGFRRDRLKVSRPSRQGRPVDAGRSHAPVRKPRSLIPPLTGNSDDQRSLRCATNWHRFTVVPGR